MCSQTQVLDESYFADCPQSSRIKRVKVGILKSVDQEYAVFQGDNCIGRNDVCDIVINNSNISGKHAVIEVEDLDTHVLYDCGSTNGTRLNQKKLVPNLRYFLEYGNIISFGNVIVTYLKVKENNDSDSETDSESMLTGTLVPNTPEMKQNIHHIKQGAVIDNSSESGLDELEEDFLGLKCNVNDASSSFSTTETSEYKMLVDKSSIKDKNIPEESISQAATQINEKLSSECKVKATVLGLQLAESDDSLDDIIMPSQIDMSLQLNQKKKLYREIQGNERNNSTSSSGLLFKNEVQCSEIKKTLIQSNDPIFDLPTQEPESDILLFSQDCTVDTSIQTPVIEKEEKDSLNTTKQKLILKISESQDPVFDLETQVVDPYKHSFSNIENKRKSFKKNFYQNTFSNEKDIKELKHLNNEIKNCSQKDKTLGCSVRGNPEIETDYDIFNALTQKNSNIKTPEGDEKMESSNALKTGNKQYETKHQGNKNPEIETDYDIFNALTQKNSNIKTPEGDEKMESSNALKTGNKQYETKHQGNKNPEIETDYDIFNALTQKNSNIKTPEGDEKMESSNALKTGNKQYETKHQGNKNPEIETDYDIFNALTQKNSNIKTPEGDEKMESSNALKTGNKQYETKHQGNKNPEIETDYDIFNALTQKNSNIKTPEGDEKMESSNALKTGNKQYETKHQGNKNPEIETDYDIFNALTQKNSNIKTPEGDEKMESSNALKTGNKQYETKHQGNKNPEIETDYDIFNALTQKNSNIKNTDTYDNIDSSEPVIKELRHFNDSKKNVEKLKKGKGEGYKQNVIKINTSKWSLNKSNVEDLIETDDIFNASTQKSGNIENSDVRGNVDLSKDVMIELTQMNDSKNSKEKLENREDKRSEQNDKIKTSKSSLNKSNTANLMETDYDIFNALTQKNNNIKIVDVRGNVDLSNDVMIELTQMNDIKNDEGKLKIREDKSYGQTDIIKTSKWSLNKNNAEDLIDTNYDVFNASTQKNISFKDSEVDEEMDTSRDVIKGNKCCNEINKIFEKKISKSNSKIDLEDLIETDYDIFNALTQKNSNIKTAETIEEVDKSSTDKNETLQQINDKVKCFKINELKGNSKRLSSLKNDLSSQQTKSLDNLLESKVSELHLNKSDVSEVLTQVNSVLKVNKNKTVILNKNISTIMEEIDSNQVGNCFNLDTELTEVNLNLKHTSFIHLTSNESVDICDALTQINDNLQDKSEIETNKEQDSNTSFPVDKDPICVDLIQEVNHQSDKKVLTKNSSLSKETPLLKRSMNKLQHKVHLKSLNKIKSNGDIKKSSPNKEKKSHKNTTLGVSESQDPIFSMETQVFNTNCENLTSHDFILNRATQVLVSNTINIKTPQDVDTENPVYNMATQIQSSNSNNLSVGHQLSISDTKNIDKSVGCRALESTSISEALTQINCDLQTENQFNRTIQEIVNERADSNKELLDTNDNDSTDVDEKIPQSRESLSVKKNLILKSADINVNLAVTSEDSNQSESLLNIVSEDIDGTVENVIGVNGIISFKINNPAEIHDQATSFTKEVGLDCDNVEEIEYNDDGFNTPSSVVMEEAIAAFEATLTPGREPVYSDDGDDEEENTVKSQEKRRTFRLRKRTIRYIDVLNSPLNNKAHEKKSSVEKLDDSKLVKTVIKCTNKNPYIKLQHLSPEEIKSYESNLIKQHNKVVPEHNVVLPTKLRSEKINVELNKGLKHERKPEQRKPALLYDKSGSKVDCKKESNVPLNVSTLLKSETRTIKESTDYIKKREDKECIIQTFKKQNKECSSSHNTTLVKPGSNIFKINVIFDHKKLEEVEEKECTNPKLTKQSNECIVEKTDFYDKVGHKAKQTNSSLCIEKNTITTSEDVDKNKRSLRSSRQALVKGNSFSKEMSDKQNNKSKKNVSTNLINGNNGELSKTNSESIVIKDLEQSTSNRKNTVVQKFHIDNKTVETRLLKESEENIKMKNVPKLSNNETSIYMLQNFNKVKELDHFDSQTDSDGLKTAIVENSNYLTRSKQHKNLECFQSLQTSHGKDVDNNDTNKVISTPTRFVEAVATDIVEKLNIHPGDQMSKENVTNLSNFSSDQTVLSTKLPIISDEVVKTKITLRERKKKNYVDLSKGNVQKSVSTKTCKDILQKENNTQLKTVMEDLNKNKCGSKQNLPVLEKQLQTIKKRPARIKCNQNLERNTNEQGQTFINKQENNNRKHKAKDNSNEAPPTKKSKRIATRNKPNIHTTLDVKQNILDHVGSTNLNEVERQTTSLNCKDGFKSGSDKKVTKQGKTHTKQEVKQPKKEYCLNMESNLDVVKRNSSILYDSDYMGHNTKSDFAHNVNTSDASVTDCSESKNQSAYPAVKNVNTSAINLRKRRKLENRINQDSTSEDKEGLRNSFDEENCSKSYSSPPTTRMIRRKEQVLFTSAITDSILKENLKELGCTIAEDPRTCTVFVTDKIRRTFKLFSCVGRGIPIVSPNWINESKRIGVVQDPWKYLTEDKEAENKFSFSLARSLSLARKKPFLANYVVFATTSVSPPPCQLKEIVELCGGKFLNDAPKTWQKNSIIISCNEDQRLLRKMRNKCPQPVIVASECILTGVLQQRLDVKSFKIN